MTKLAAVIALLIVVAGGAEAQTMTGAGPYVITGSVLAPHADFPDEFDVILLDTADMVAGRLRMRTQQQFTFRVREQGDYYVRLDVAGFKRVLERADVGAIQKEARLPIVLEPEDVIIEKRPNMTGEDLAVNASDLLPSAGILKKFQEADKKLLSGDVSGARSRLESVVMEAPDFYEGHRALGETYQRSRRYSEAEREFQIARDLRPFSAAPWIHLGSLYLEQCESGDDQSPSAHGGIEAARKALLRAIELSPQAAFAHYLLGVTYYELSQWGEAEASLVRALELEPRFGQVHLGLAKVYIQVQDVSKARTHLDTYLKETPGAPDRDRILEALKRIDLLAEGGKATAGDRARQVR